MIHTKNWNFLFPIYQGQRPYLVAARTKPSTLIPIFVAGRASETAGMGSDLAEAPKIQLGAFEQAGRAFDQAGKVLDPAEWAS